MVWNNVYFPQVSVLIFTCGPNPLERDNTYSQALPLVRTSMTFQGRLLVQEDRAMAKMSSFFIVFFLQSGQESNLL